MSFPHARAHPLDVLARASRASSWGPSCDASAALSAGALSVEIASLDVEKLCAEAASTTAVDAACADDAAAATPAAPSAGSSHSAAAETEGSAATGDAGDGSGGYVTPPLRSAELPAAGTPGDHGTTRAPDESSPLAASSDPRQVVAEPPPSQQRPPDTSNVSSSAALFTPTLLATASPVGGILSPTGNKRKRVDTKREKPPGGARSSAGRTASAAGSSTSSSTPKRKGSIDFLRKGQWTATEEKFTRALLNAFDDGYLPIFSGVRLRGYLAVQLQCDPMRISKKLCGGTVDGKKVPKNYGQMKYKMRKPHLWDDAEAARVLAELEKLMRDLWAEAGVARPSYLTLSSTRTSGDDGLADASTDSRYDTRAEWLSDCGSSSSSGTNSPVPNGSTADASAFPIIYLNLAKKHKKNGVSCGGGAAAAPVTSCEASSAAVRRSDNGKKVAGGAAWKRGAKVDGDSLQAAYDLLHLLQAPADDAA